MNSTTYTADLSIAADRGGCFFDTLGQIANDRLAGYSSKFTKPPHVGLYAVRPPNPQIETGTQFYAWWNGEFWCRSRAGRDAAMGMLDERARVQCKAWREAAPRD